MEQMAERLATLGMSDHAECFTENDIAASVLPHRTEQALNEASVRAQGRK